MTESWEGTLRRLRRKLFRRRGASTRSLSRVSRAGAHRSRVSLRVRLLRARRSNPAEQLSAIEDSLGPGYELTREFARVTVGDLRLRGGRGYEYTGPGGKTVTAYLRPSAAAQRCNRIPPSGASTSSRSSPSRQTRPSKTQPLCRRDPSNSRARRDLCRARRVRYVVEIQFGIRRVVVDRRRDAAVAKREEADDRLERTRAAEQVAGHRLRRRDEDLVRVIAEDLLDRQSSPRDRSAASTCRAR